MRRRMCVWSTVILFVAISLGGANPSHALSSCVPLNRLLGYADSGFRQLRGYRDPRISGWVATYRMPGAARCTIEDVDDTAYYLCQWAQDPKAESDSDVYADLIQYVTRCLKPAETSEHSEGQDKQSVRFGIAGARKTVVVEKIESPRSGRLVTLYVIPRALKELSSQ